MTKKSEAYWRWTYFCFFHLPSEVNDILAKLCEDCAVINDSLKQLLGDFETSEGRSLA